MTYHKKEPKQPIVRITGVMLNDFYQKKVIGSIALKKRDNPMTLDDLITELDEARTLAKEHIKPSARITATMAKAKLLGLDTGITDADEPTPVKIVVQTIDARLRDDDRAVNEPVTVFP